MDVRRQVSELLLIGNRIGRSPLYTALMTVRSAISIGIGAHRRTLTRQSLLPVTLTVAPESTALAVVRSATSSDFGAPWERFGGGGSDTDDISTLREEAPVVGSTFA